MQNKFDVYEEMCQMWTLGYFWVAKLRVTYLLFVCLYFFPAISLHFLIVGRKEAIFPFIFFLILEHFEQI